METVLQTKRPVQKTALNRLNRKRRLLCFFMGYPEKSPLWQSTDRGENQSFFKNFSNT